MANSWPDQRDYIVAVQTAQYSFAQPYLRTAEIRSGTMGIPESASGKFAIVFRATVESRDYAIKCFTRQATYQRERYQALHEHIAKNRLPYLVDFKYLDSEILVLGERYPVLQMSWASGDTLGRWLGLHLDRKREIAALAGKWQAMIADLSACRMAHGDLSADNCLVDGTSLALIDYDGFFIPALANSASAEAGDPEFQHPRRGGHYAADLDHFPALVIYLSLLALAQDKSLWKYHTGRNLIFTATDYAQPRATPVWKDLARSKDPTVTALTSALADMCEAPVNSLPPLAYVVNGASGSAGQAVPWWRTWPAPSDEAKAAQRRHQNQPWWITSPDAAAAETSKVPPEPAWWTNAQVLRPSGPKLTSQFVIQGPATPVRQTWQGPTKPLQQANATQQTKITRTQPPRPPAKVPHRVPGKRPVPAGFFVFYWLLALLALIIGIVQAIHHYG
jgi:hypothetical protein